MDKLRIPKKKKVGGNLFRSGMYLGVALPILVFLIWTIATEDQKSFPRFESVFIVYRMLALIVIMIWAWGIDMWVWSKFRVNYVFIFDFNARSHVRHQHMLEAGALLTFVWAWSLLLYVLHSLQPTGFGWLGEVPYQFFPLSLIITIAVMFVRFQLISNWWLFRTLYRTVTAPFHAIRFKDFFLADQLASLAIVLYDMEYTACFFLYDAWAETDYCMTANVWTRPLIATLPSFWRFLQCLRRYRDGPESAHLWNAGKYSMAFFVALFSVLRANYSSSFFPVWLVFISLSTLYTYTWDIFRDWSLGNLEANFLRKKLIYKGRWFYYTAIIGNLFLRLAWTMTISPESLGIVMSPLYFASLLAVVEIFRRAVWNLFRVENEQLNNVGKFRAFNVQVPPSDQESINSLLHQYSIFPKRDK